jgi:cytochrome c-type biogenesis protein CcmH/NrfF
MTASVDRREFLASLFGALVMLPLAQNPQDSLPGTGPAGRLWDPQRAGKGVEPVTAGDNDLAIQKIEKQLKCTCGCGLDVYTCRTTDFTCSVSPAMHKQVLAFAATGLSGPQILAAFVQANGPAVLMEPPKHGFNLAGYFVPGAAVLTAGVLLFFALRRWTHTAAPAPALMPAAPNASAGELEQLQRALDKFEA